MAHTYWMGVSMAGSGDIQPPLIHRDDFFEDPDISGAQLSPDGKYISFLRPYNGTRNIYLKKIDQPFSDAWPVTIQDKRPIGGYFWSRDGKYLLYVIDNGGDENFNIYALSPGQSKKGQVPESKNLTELEGIRVLIYHLCREDEDLMYLGINDRDPAWHDLYSLKISTGELTLLKENKERYVNWMFDWKDRLRLAVKNREDGTTELWKVDGDRQKKLLEWSVLESVNPLFFDSEDCKLYVVSNRGDEVNISALYLMDPDSGEMKFVEKDPDKRVDFGGLKLSEKKKSILCTAYTYDRTRRYFKDRDFETIYKKVKSEAGDKEVSFFSPTKGEDLWLVQLSSDRQPGEVFLCDAGSGELTFQYSLRPKLKEEKLSGVQHITYPSSDGLEIPAYLTLPQGFGKENLPLVVMPHGGPWVRDFWGYDGYTQFLANRGFAVLRPNFRISTGFGKKFLNAGNREWGDKMQDDLTWGVRYLVDKGIADPSRIGIFGGSYGGYAALAGLAFTPDLYACGVSFVGPSNLITLLNSIPPYWEAGRKMFHVRMGDPNTEEGKAQLERQSPLHSAHKIKAPLMVVQGQNDPRVKKAESDQIAIALRDRGFPVTYLNAVDEGHGFARPENRMAFIAVLEEFLAKHLKGRYQEERSGPLDEKIRQMTVDIKKLEL